MAEVGNIEPKEVHEQVGAIFGHMEYTGEYLEKGFNQVLKAIAESSRSRRRRTENLLLDGSEDDNNMELLGDGMDEVDELILGQVAKLQDVMEDRFEDVKNLRDVMEDRFEDVKNLQDVIEDRFEDISQRAAQTAFDMSVEIAKKESPATLVILTVLNGVPVDAKIEVMAYDKETKEMLPISFDSISLDKGKIALELNEDGSEVELLFVKATPLDGGASEEKIQAERTQLVALK